MITSMSKYGIFINVLTISYTCMVYFAEIGLLVELERQTSMAPQVFIFFPSFSLFEIAFIIKNYYIQGQHVA